MQNFHITLQNFTAAYGKRTSSDLHHCGDMGYTVTESFCKLYALLLRKVRKLYAPLLEIGLLDTVVLKVLGFSTTIS